jgi:hypothetical protein
MNNLTKLSAAIVLSIAALSVSAASTQGRAPSVHTAASAHGSVSATGQPNQSCEDTPNLPGNAEAAPGSPFNPTGVSGGVYAGEQPQNSRNPKSVSQYDAACARPPHG